MRESTLWAEGFFPLDKDMSVTIYYYLLKEGEKLLKFTQSMKSLNVIIKGLNLHRINFIYI